MRFTLYGNPATKKNSQRIITVNGYPKILPSQAYKFYEKKCLKQIHPSLRRRIDSPVNVQCLYFMPTRRRVDLANLHSAMHDILVRAGVLADDNRNIIAGTDGSRVFYDRENPRVEIEITPMTDYEQWSRR